MQFNNVVAAIITLLPLALAVPAAQVSDACTNGSYDACVASVFCIASWPESCICINEARTTCATACGVAEPELQDCTSSKIKRAASCYNDCTSGRACIQSWPASCHCANGIKTECATTCGVAVPALQDCGDSV